MGSNVESGFYWEGYAAGMHGKSWMRVPHSPGTRAFHQYLEGHADGVRARMLQKHAAAERQSTHHAHGAHGYHGH